jgi:thermitase
MLGHFPVGGIHGDFTDRSAIRGPRHNTPCSALLRDGIMWSICRTAAVVIVVCAFAAPLSAQLIPNDTYYAQYQWYSPVIGEPTAWATSTGSSSVTVAVLDDGVVSYTPDMAGRILPALSAVSGQDPFADSWLTNTSLNGGLNCHGTWVASAAAMTVNNAMGGAGVGNFSILPIRITEVNLNAPDSWIAAGIRMAADNGAKVINISYYAIDYAQVDTAAAYARSKGALTFISAGNTDGYRGIASYSNLIFVSGTQENGQRWSKGSGVGSSYGAFVDIAAPASNILLADPTTVHGYGLNSGTSFAAPLVAGAAALAWSIDPLLTPDEVEQMLYSTAVNPNNPSPGSSTPYWDQIFGWGVLNVGAIAQAAKTAYLASIPEPAAWLLLASAGIAVLLRRRLMD